MGYEQGHYQRRSPWLRTIVGIGAAGALGYGVYYGATEAGIPGKVKDSVTGFINDVRTVEVNSEYRNTTSTSSSVPLGGPNTQQLPLELPPDELCGYVQPPQTPNAFRVLKEIKERTLVDVFSNKEYDYVLDGQNSEKPRNSVLLRDWGDIDKVYTNDEICVVPEKSNGVQKKATRLETKVRSKQAIVYQRGIRR